MNILVSIGGHGSLAVTSVRGKMSYQSLVKKPMPVGFGLSKLGAILSIGGIAFAFSPIALAILATPPGGNPFSEGGGSGGSAIWFMILTLPVGGFASIVGLFFMLGGILHTMKTEIPEDQALRSKLMKEKSLSFALLVPSLMLMMPVLSFVSGNMIASHFTPELIIFASTGLAIIGIVMAIIFAIKSKAKKFQIVTAVSAVLVLSVLSFEAVQLYLTFKTF